MAGPEPRLHLPFAQWPREDQLLWTRSMSSDDPFSCGGGARLSKATRHSYLFGWRRILGFLAMHEPEALELAPDERLTPDRIRALVAHLAETNTPRSVASVVHAVYLAARMMMPEGDWTWLKSIKTRLQAAVPVSSATGVARHGKLPPRRHEELPPPWLAEERANARGANHGKPVVE